MKKTPKKNSKLWARPRGAAIKALAWRVRYWAKTAGGVFAILWAAVFVLSVAPMPWIARECLRHKGPWSAFEVIFLAVAVAVSLAISGCAIVMGAFVRDIAIWKDGATPKKRQLEEKIARLKGQAAAEEEARSLRNEVHAGPTTKNERDASLVSAVASKKPAAKRL